MRKKIWWLGMGLGLGMAGYRAYSSWASRKLRPGARESDYRGNYDLDGVSYDRDLHSVVVSGDATERNTAGAQFH
jgi:hypothetical protein